MSNVVKVNKAKLLSILFLSSRDKKFAKFLQHNSNLFISRETERQENIVVSENLPQKWKNKHSDRKTKEHSLPLQIEKHLRDNYGSEVQKQREFSLLIYGSFSRQKYLFQISKRSSVKQKWILSQIRIRFKM